jgi:hypothetical protein
VVHLHSVKDDHCRSKLEYPREKGDYKHRKNVGCYNLWRKHDIEFGDEDSESSSLDSMSPQWQPHSSLPPHHQTPLSPPPQ